MTQVVCPDCRGIEDRWADLCGMCSDQGVAEESCFHVVYERYHAECDCPIECHACGADLESEGDDCWSCGA